MSALKHTSKIIQAEQVLSMDVYVYTNILIHIITLIEKRVHEFVRKMMEESRHGYIGSLWWEVKRKCYYIINSKIRDKTLKILSV